MSLRDISCRVRGVVKRGGQRLSAPLYIMCGRRIPRPLLGYAAFITDTCGVFPEVPFLQKRHRRCDAL